MGAFHLVKISGISGSAVNGTRFVGSSTGEFPEKVENLKRWARFPRGGGGGYSHTLPIWVCAAQRGRDFEAPDLERGIHFRGVF